MNKLVVTISCILMMSTGAWAQKNKAYARQSVPSHQAQQITDEPEIIRLARQGDLGGLRRLFNREGAARHFAYDHGLYYSVLKQQDKHGNNVFHLASTWQTFEFLNVMAHNQRDELLAQKNNAGETPWMSLLTYNRASIFVKEFPNSALRQKMRAVTKELNSSGVNLMVAEIKRNALVQECSAGGQTMWQRADALWRSAPEGSREKAAMYSVRNMIGRAAPFLIR